VTLQFDATDVKLESAGPAESVLRRNPKLGGRGGRAINESTTSDLASLGEDSPLSIEDFVRDDMLHGSTEFPQKLLLTVTEASHVLAISRTKLYDLLCSGHLRSVRIGRSRRIRMRDLEEFVASDGCEY
jgi:excisionase family DNA binding protein